MPSGSLSDRYAFGTARIHRMAPNDAERLLASAHDVGFRHFDTAPLYGFGNAERLLREVAGRPGTIIATKVGLYPPGGTDQGRLETILRKVAGKALPRLSRAVISGSVAAARRSLEGSLTRLGRDHVDLLLIHEPVFSLLQTDEWLRWFEDERGRVLAFGLAGEPQDLLPFIEAGSPLAAIVQSRDGHGEADMLRHAGRRPDLVYGFSAFADAAQRDAAIRVELAKDDAVRLIVSSRDPAALAARLAPLIDDHVIRSCG